MTFKKVGSSFTLDFGSPPKNRKQELEILLKPTKLFEKATTLFFLNDAWKLSLTELHDLSETYPNVTRIKLPSGVEREIGDYLLWMLDQSLRIPNQTE